MAEDALVLSIQSHVAYGHVGNSAAVFPLQRLGFDVVPVHTVQLAHHPGYGRFCGTRAEPETLQTIVAGLDAIGVLGRCAAVLSGYLGRPETGEVVLDAASRVRALRSDAPFLCDPVIGDDDGGVFVDAAVVEVIRERLVPAADIITPNAFELALLADRPVRSVEDALAASAVLQRQGRPLVVATGLRVGANAGEVTILAATETEAWGVSTPWRDAVLHGTGDAFSALFLGHFLRRHAIPDALERAAAAMHALVEMTVRARAAELQLVAAQAAFADPPLRFRALRVR